MSELSELLRLTATRVADYRKSAGDRPVAPPVDYAQLRAALGGSLPAEGADPHAVIEQLATAAEPALVTTVGPRYFGLVVGGALDAATCADLLTTGWDQIAFNPTASPVAAAVEEVVGEWLKQAFGLPADSSFGLVTGAQGANTVGLAAARHRVLAQAGWDVETRGMIGAPRIRVLAGEERHATIDRSLRLLGIGAEAVSRCRRPQRCDRSRGPGGSPGCRLRGAHHRLPPGWQREHRCLRRSRRRVRCRAPRGAWVHVDGAFGLWAAVSPSKRSLVTGIEQADSWASRRTQMAERPLRRGLRVLRRCRGSCRVDVVHRRLSGGPGRGVGPSPSDYVPESSRRARGFATWAALRELGREGLAELVDRCCALARRFGEQLGSIEGVEIANDIVLNQVLVSFGSDERTDRLIAAVQRDGTCWMGGTSWRGRRFMRISVSNWSTTEADVDRSVGAIRRLLSRDG